MGKTAKISKKHKLLFILLLLTAGVAVFYASSIQEELAANIPQTSSIAAPELPITLEQAPDHENAVVDQPTITSNLNSDTLQTVIMPVLGGGAESVQEVKLITSEELHQAHDQTYLKQMRAVASLITQFIQRVNYDSSLAAIDQMKLPSDVQQVLNNMKSYHEKYMQRIESETVIFPQKGVMDELVGRFVQVKKLPIKNPEESMEYDRIIQEIHILEDYFYSEQFLKQDKP